MVKTDDGGGSVAKWCPTLVTSWTIARQAPLSMGFPSKNTGVVAMPSSRGSSQPRDRTQVSRTADRFFTSEPPGKPIKQYFSLAQHLQKGQPLEGVG